QTADLRLEPQHAPLRRARAQIPVAILAVVMRAERVAKEVEALVSAVPEHGLRLIEREPQPGQHLPRPCQSLGGSAAAQDDEVVGIGDDVGTVSLASSGAPPVLQEAVHVE